MNRLLLNCDLGEGMDHADARIIPLIDQANIACGGHAGDERSMLRCISLAHFHQVALGAHPSYPDKAHFGRRSLKMSALALRQSLHDQVASFNTLCEQQGLRMQHIKAHGALYNDSLREPRLLRMLFELASEFHCALMIQATPESHPSRVMVKRFAREYDVTVLREGFADRRYTESGALQPRNERGAVLHEVEAIVRQAEAFASRSAIESCEGMPLTLEIESLCVHGDNEVAIEAVEAIRNVCY